jgi:ATP-dependent DNA helicase RecG
MAPAPPRSETPVQFVKGVGPRLAESFAAKGVRTVEDLLYFLPRAYEDRRTVTPIRALREGERRLVVGAVQSARVARTRRGMTTFEAVVFDGTGFVTAVWFNAPRAWLEPQLRPDTRVILVGEMRIFRDRMQMNHPDFEMLDDESTDSLHFGRIVAVYSESEGLRQKRLRRILDAAVRGHLGEATDVLPRAIADGERLMPLADALGYVHQPPDDANVEELARFRSPGHRRIVFDELFLLFVGVALRRRGVEREKAAPLFVPAGEVKAVLEKLPFALTTAQRRALRDVWRDMARPSPMHRLIQGDVGCGKTVVALVAAAAARRAGRQSALLAPTEILAEQHYRTTRALAGALGLRSALLTAAVPSGDRERIVRALKAGTIDLVVGTHALIQEPVAFARLGLAIIDEQHRFGVGQRRELLRKGTGDERPHLLVMTATPIPRTLAMTLYGDLDLSVIDELPPGRRPVATRVYSEKERADLYGAMRAEMEKGRQVFVVYPLVEESEKLDVRAATEMHERLQEVFPEHQLGLLHGRMKPAEKDAAMERFRRGEVRLLVATTVVEVGVDVANATLMVVEHADRFGLTQLHQLRGRIGRGEHDSRCLLVVSAEATDEAKRRLVVMERTSDGFEIAEEDLAMRGPGEFLGTRQAGMPELRVANLARDADVLARAGAAARAFVERTDPADPEFRAVLDELARRWPNSPSAPAAG